MSSEVLELDEIATRYVHSRDGQLAYQVRGSGPGLASLTGTNPGLASAEDPLSAVYSERLEGCEPRVCSSSTVGRD